MRLVDHIGSVFTCVELVHIDVTLRSTSKKVSTVGESQLSASLDRNNVIRLQTFLKNVHHSDSVSESDDQVEARWVESYTIGFVMEHLADLESWWVRVVPDSNGLVDGAGGDQVFLDADVHSLDSSGVERVDQVLVL